MCTKQTYSEVNSHKFGFWANLHTFSRSTALHLTLKTVFVCVPVKLTLR